MTIGNVADAMAAVMGAGQFIGEGFDRRAYLINGVVYKVSKSVDNYYQNRELENMRSAVSPEPWVRVPEISRYDVAGVPVNALPFIDGTPVDDFFDELVIALFEMNMQDHAADNILVDKDGIFWVIDFGE